MTVCNQDVNEFSVPLAIIWRLCFARLGCPQYSQTPEISFFRQVFLLNSIFFMCVCWSNYEQIAGVELCLRICKTEVAGPQANRISCQMDSLLSCLHWQERCGFLPALYAYSLRPIRSRAVFALLIKNIKQDWLDRKLENGLDWLGSAVIQAYKRIRLSWTYLNRNVF